MKRLFTTLLFFFLITIHAAAQRPMGKISGKIIDATTKEPVEYATIAIYQQNAKSPFNGSITNNKGNFVLNNLAYGDYQLVIDFIGYQRFTISHVTLSQTKSGINLGNLSINSANKQLNSVEISGQKSTIENKLDKLIYNVGNDLTSQGGVATDILKKVPMVTVDIDGNVELLGNPSVRFLINGKPSSIFGASLADALQSIPSSQIKSIEVITSPGAKYDATGTGGIINIILKDNTLHGYNGSVNLSAGTRLENSSVNLNLRQNNFGVNAYFSGNKALRSKTLNTRTRSDILGDTTQNQFQNGYGNAQRQGFQSGIGLDWNLSKKDDLSAAFSYHHFSNKSDGITNQEDQALKGQIPYSDLFSLRNSSSEFGENAIDVNLEYKKTFKKEGQELDIQYNTSFNRNIGNYYQKLDYQYVGRPSSGANGDNPGTDHETEINADYAHPITEAFLLETGLKANIENISTTSSVNTFDPSINEFLYDQNQSHAFIYGRNVYAYYLSASFKILNFFEIKTGLRDEYTSTAVDFAGGNIPDYNFLSPSFVISHKLTKSQTIKLAYSKRIERPDFGDLNPFINYSDPYNISYGNPNLHPEIGNNFELGYNNAYGKGGNINITAFYRHNGFDVKQYTFLQDSLQESGGVYYKNVYVQTRANVGSEVTLGLNISASIPLTEKLTIRPNILLVQRRVMDNLPNTPDFIRGVESRINMNATYQFQADLAAEAFINYNTPRVGLQGSNSSFASYNFAARKQFLNKKFSLGLTANVPFNEYVNQSSTITQQLPRYSYQYSLRQVPFRSFGITLSYKFGKLEFKKEKDDIGNPPSLPDQGN